MNLYCVWKGCQILAASLGKNFTLRKRQKNVPALDRKSRFIQRAVQKEVVQKVKIVLNDNKKRSLDLLKYCLNLICCQVHQKKKFQDTFQKKKITPNMINLYNEI